MITYEERLSEEQLAGPKVIGFCFIIALFWFLVGSSIVLAWLI
jgi:hypothetical protein